MGSSNNNGGNSGGNNKGGRDQGPPDLDDIFRKLSKKLSGFGGGKGSNSNSGGTGTSGPGFSGRIIGIAAVAVVVIWAASGFYTIKEAERGVVTRFGKFSHGAAGPELEADLHRRRASGERGIRARAGGVRRDADLR